MNSVPELGSMVKGLLSNLAREKANWELGCCRQNGQQSEWPITKLIFPSR